MLFRSDQKMTSIAKDVKELQSDVASLTRKVDAEVNSVDAHDRWIKKASVKIGLEYVAQDPTGL